jgi:hypothetical protein
MGLGACSAIDWNLNMAFLMNTNSQNSAFDIRESLSLLARFIFSSAGSTLDGWENPALRHLRK